MKSLINNFILFIMCMQIEVVWLTKGNYVINHGQKLNCVQRKLNSCAVEDLFWQVIYFLRLFISTHHTLIHNIFISCTKLENKFILHRMQIAIFISYSIYVCIICHGLNHNSKKYFS